VKSTRFTFDAEHEQPASPLCYTIYCIGSNRSLYQRSSTKKQSRVVLIVTDRSF